MDLNTRASVLEQLRRKRRGWVFTTLDFPDAADPQAVKEVLRQLQQKGRVKKIARGVFHYPRHLRNLNIEVPPDPMKVARAVARLHGHRIAPSGATAANRLGLSAQVPARPVYLTDGPSKEIPLGKWTIVLRHVPANQVRVGGDLERTLVQAIFYLGREGVDEHALLKLRQAVPTERRPRVLAAAKRVGGWVGQIMQQIALPPINEAVRHG